ncbi:hypothetical protein XENOCAPTIV_004853 [Xenoophorus captivus]|uniref:Uncharacterized protein n=1 Tax=Xenoophorus captivus TaxID=1517983 RepID=A0ABV0SBJ8_9TELE
MTNMCNLGYSISNNTHHNKHTIPTVKRAQGRLKELVRTCWRVQKKRWRFTYNQYFNGMVHIHILKGDCPATVKACKYLTRTEKLVCFFYLRLQKLEQSSC